MEVQEIKMQENLETATSSGTFPLFEGTRLEEFTEALGRGEISWRHYVILVDVESKKLTQPTLARAGDVDTRGAVAAGKYFALPALILYGLARLYSWATRRKPKDQP